MTGIIASETCSAYHKCNKTISSIYLVPFLQLSQQCTVQYTSKVMNCRFSKPLNLQKKKNTLLNTGCLIAIVSCAVQNTVKYKHVWFNMLLCTLKCHIRVKIVRNFSFLALQNAFRKSRNYGVQNTIRSKLNSTRCVPRGRYVGSCTCVRQYSRKLPNHLVALVACSY